MRTPQPARCTVVARFDSLAAAQRAVSALGVAGIDGDSISLAGPVVDEAHQQLATDEADVRVLTHILKYIIVGAVTGTVIGAALSPPAGWIVLLLLGLDVTAKAMLLSLFLTTLMSHMIGGFIGYTMAMQAGQSWELSFQSTGRGEVYVRVHADKPRAIERAEQTLRRVNAIDLRRIDP